MPETVDDLKGTLAQEPQSGESSSEIGESIFQEAVEKDPGDAAKHCKLADIYRRKQKLALAEAEYKQAIKLDSRNDIYHWSLGQFYEYESGKLVLAETAYKEALRLSPGNPHNRLCLGRIYEKQGKLAQAESEYRILAESSPAYGDLVARVCEKLGRTEMAIEEYGRASEQPEMMLPAGEMRGRGFRPSLHMVGIAAVAILAAFGLVIWMYGNKVADYAARPRNAESDKKAVSEKLTADNTDLKNNLTDTEAERDRLKIRDNVAKYLASVSKYSLAGQTGDAIQELNVLIQADPSNSVAHYWLGDLYRRENRIEDAKIFYLKAVKLGCDEADEALKAMESAAAAKKAAVSVAKKPETARTKEKADLARIKHVYEASFLGKVRGLSGISNSSFLLASKEDILAFVSILLEYEGREGVADTGLFLSGLINNLAEGESVELDLSHFLQPLNYLGTNLRSRDLTIKGNAGLFLGRSMRSGTITLSEGNAGACVGRSMAGGEIVIKGNAGDSVGYFMRAGKITVEGSAGAKVGDRMTGGEILAKGNAGKLVGSNMSGGVVRLNGGYKSLSRRITGGEIYDKGTKIHP